jgi:hypothetical protein
MRRITPRSALPALLAAGALVALAAPPASAHEVRIVGGKTTLSVSAKATAALRAAGIAAKGTSYRATGGVYSFHALDDGGGGTIRHAGALRLSRDTATVALGRLTIDLPPVPEHEAAASRGAAKVLSAVVGGRRIAVARLDAKRYRPLEEDPGFTGLRVVLNRAAARLLNERLSTTAFARGLVLGTLGNASRVEEIPE